MTPFDSIGLWFLPSDPEKQIPGTIRFSPDDGLILSLSGTFQTSWTIETAKYSIIHGVVSGSPYGKFISLFNGFATNLKIGMPGISLETIRINHGFVGSSFIQSEDTLFHEAAVYFSPLANWLNYSGLTTEHSPGNDIVARWHKQEPLHANVAGARISTEFDFCTTVATSPRTISFEETPTLSIRCHDGSTAEEIHTRFVGPLARLMTFASDYPNDVTAYKLSQMVGTDDDVGRFERIYTPIDQRLHQKGKKGPNPQHFLFRLRDVPDDFSLFLPAWFSFVQNHPDFCSMFFSYAYQDTGYLEARFLFRMLAMQLLAREQYASDPSLTVFHDLRTSFLKATELANQSYPGFVIPSPYQMATPTLLEKLFNQHWRIINDIVGTDQRRFISALFASLDHVTNRGIPAPDAIASTDLFWLSERLSCVIKLCVLKILGFADERIANIKTTHPQIPYLKVTKEPWSASTVKA